MPLTYRTVKTPRIWPRYLRLGPTLPGANFARKVPLFKSYSVSNDSPSMLRFKFYKSENSELIRLGKMSACLERRSVPRPLSGLLLSIEKSNIHSTQPM